MKDEQRNIRNAIDESLSGVRFNANDMRSVMRAVRSREEEPEQPVRRRRAFRPDFAFAVMLAVIVIAPVSLMLARSRNTRPVAVAPGVATVRPSDVSSPSPHGEEAGPTPAIAAITPGESEAIRIAKACFEATCDTSVFSFEEYTVSVSSQEQADGSTHYTVTMDSVYDNGCAFTAVVSLPSGEVVQHSTPRLATVPTFFDSGSAEVRSWYDKYGPYLFTWDAQAQVEFSRRYEGAAIRQSAQGEMTYEEATAAAVKAIAESGEYASLFAEVTAYPVLYAESGNADAAARYVVYCFGAPVTDTLGDTCLLVTLTQGGHTVESIQKLTQDELSAML